MKKKSILISAIAMLAVSAIVLSTATYAWFVGTITPSITNIEVGVVQRNLLALSGTSTDGVDGIWGPVLDVKTAAQWGTDRYQNKWQAKGAAATHQADGLDAVTPFRTGATQGTPTGTPPVTPVTDMTFATDNIAEPLTTDLATDMKLDFVGKAVGSTSAASTYFIDNANVIVMDIFMRADRACSVALLTDSASTIYTKIDTNLAGNDDDQKLIDYSIRMGFLFSEEFDGTDVAAYDTALYEGLKIWAPQNPATASSLRGSDANSGWAEGEGYTTDAFGNGAGSNMDLFEFELASYGCRRVIIYMWIEGADKDCVDAAAGGLFNALIAFTGEVTTTP